MALTQEQALIEQAVEILSGDIPSMDSKQTTGPITNYPIAPCLPGGPCINWRTQQNQDDSTADYKQRNPKGSQALDRIDAMVYPLLRQRLITGEDKEWFLGIRNHLAKSVESPVWLSDEFQSDEKLKRGAPQNIYESSLEQSWEYLRYELSKARHNYNKLNGLLGKKRTLLIDRGIPLPNAHTILAWSSFLGLGVSRDNPKVHCAVLPSLIPAPKIRGFGEKLGAVALHSLPEKNKQHQRNEDDQVIYGMDGILQIGEGDGSDFAGFEPLNTHGMRVATVCTPRGNFQVSLYPGTLPLWNPYMKVHHPLATNWVEQPGSEIDWGLRSLAYTYGVMLKFTEYKNLYPWVTAYAKALREVLTFTKGSRLTQYLNLLEGAERISNLRFKAITKLDSISLASFDSITF